MEKRAGRYCPDNEEYCAVGNRQIADCRLETADCGLQLIEKLPRLSSKDYNVHP